MLDALLANPPKRRRRKARKNPAFKHTPKEKRAAARRVGPMYKELLERAAFEKGKKRKHVKKHGKKHA